MNALVKKEIRLLLPSWMAAVLLALVQAITRPYDFYVACLLFFGLTIMALTTFGRETSLNTFSLLLAQPAERRRIWQTKISVLAVAFLIVFGVWLMAFGIAFTNSNVDASDRASSYNLFITICLIATATFTGGLWTTLLLRQIAGAFWLTLLVPATLSGFSGAFLAQNQSNNLLIAILCVIFAIYSVGGFLFARRLFFHAQDVGWSGGVISLPEWKLFAARAENAVSTRNRKPIFVLVKKEFQLQQASLMGAAGLLVLHIGVIVLRKYHHFAKDSVGEALTAIFWMLWLVMAPVIGSLAVAEERRLGVMEGQLCLPVSRRVQFAIKGIFTLCLAIFLGGVMPMLLEYLAAGFGAQNPALKPADNSGINFFWFFFAGVAVAGWLVLLCFFASTLARSFLQAVGLGIATFFISFALLITNGQTISQGFMSVHSFLPIVIGVPTLIVTLLWLAYLNYKNFRPGWPLWRRNLLGFAGAFIFVIVTSMALYHRAWEVFEPVEPAHGPARLSVSQPSILKMNDSDTLTILLPDGQVWFDFLYNDWPATSWAGWRLIINPLHKKTGPQKIIAGSNWVSATAGSVNSVYTWQQTPPVWGHPDTVGIRSDGTLWVSDNWNPKVWTGDKLTRFGDETNWQQVARSLSAPSVLLLKKDGTLWRWGTNYFYGDELPQRWPGLRAFIPYQIGTNSDWKIISTAGGYEFLAQKSDGTTWTIRVKKGGIDELIAATNFDQIPLQELSLANDYFGAYVRTNGTLWLWGELYGRGRGHTSTLQSGMETNWVSVAVAWSFRMVALKSDGTLWECSRNNPPFAVPAPPTRIGIHNDWIAIVGAGDGVVSLAADGSLWLWPDREQYERYTLLKLPKKPQFLGNVFGKAD
jgi:ABC-type transport system involved in multi-copper enzyme maturation permease subunit